MQSNHCQQTVRKALENLDQVSIEDITPGFVQVAISGHNDALILREVIQRAGYTVASMDIPSEELSDDLTLRYKTNINCSGCVEKVTGAIDAIGEVCDWEVDTNSKDKILSVHFTGDGEDQLIRAIQEKGFKIERI